MKHGITEQDWLDYSEGALADEARERLENHLTACAECWDQYQQSTATEQTLRFEAERLRRRYVLSERQMHAALYDFFARAQASEPNAEKARQLQERLEYLETMLAQMCGTRTAACAIERAVAHADVEAAATMTHERWPYFLNHLTEFARVMCGASAALLIQEKGSLG